MNIQYLELCDCELSINCHNLCVKFKKFQFLLILSLKLAFFHSFGVSIISRIAPQDQQSCTFKFYDWTNLEQCVICKLLIFSEILFHLTYQLVAPWDPANPSISSKWVREPIDSEKFTKTSTNFQKYDIQEGKPYKFLMESLHLIATY